MNANFSYHAVAVQSFWRPQKRIVFACPLPLFAELVLAFLVDQYGQDTRNDRE